MDILHGAATGRHVHTAIREYYLKIDTAANVLLNKFYYNSDACSDIVPATLCESADSIIGIGRIFYRTCVNRPTGSNQQENKYYGMKISKNSGELGKTVYCSITNNVDYFQPGTGGYAPLSSSYINTTKDSFYLVSLTNRVNGNTAYGSYKIGFDSTLTFYDGSVYYHTDKALPQLSRLDIDANNNANIIFWDTRSAVQYIAGFTGDSFIYQQKLNAPVNALESYPVDYPFVYKSQYLCVVGNYIGMRKGFLQITQFTGSEKKDDCFRQDVNFIQTAPVRVTSVASSFLNKLDGSLVKTIVVPASTTDLLITVTSSCMQVNKTVLPAATLNLGRDTILCTNKIFQLSPNSKFKNYLWQDGSTNSTYMVKQTGQYFLQATDYCSAIVSDTINVTIDTIGRFLNTTAAVCENNNLTIEPDRSFDHYLWNTGATTKSLTVQHAGKYWLTITADNLCNLTDTITVTEKDCAAGLFVPGSFTPNNDGLNDVLRPVTFNTSIIQSDFLVYARSGQLVFKSTELNNGWNGTINGTQQNTGTFIWIWRYKLNSGVEEVQRGTVLLLR
ncbi:T9SS type B sorting domain-containing protein [Ferruginibacter albus]|uniref:T9SS type B sorting domain-containing protein n=1 Tax=Ferruginibacter albus TaxID=2875540 RepID=UPI001CC7868C|nr:gliding motility-associated C-terminal domain-containing protein [Ferruginibacter albus]UAY52428.1 gliding motility-associated C-terminal domain-containing protein [Ferruginibacter albus]